MTTRITITLVVPDVVDGEPVTDEMLDEFTPDKFFDDGDLAMFERNGIDASISFERIS